MRIIVRGLPKCAHSIIVQKPIIDRERFEAWIVIEKICYRTLAGCQHYYREKNLATYSDEAALMSNTSSRTSPSAKETPLVVECIVLPLVEDIDDRGSRLDERLGQRGILCGILFCVFCEHLYNVVGADFPRLDGWPCPNICT